MRITRKDFLKSGATVMMRTIHFERLRSGELVATISSEDDGHTHLVELRCA